MSYGTYDNVHIYGRAGSGFGGPVPSDQAINLRADNYGGLFVSQLAPKYLELARRGLVFTGRSAAAAAIPKYDAMTNGPVLWNPAGSGVLVVPLYITLTQAAVASAAVTGFVLLYEEGMGSAAATGAPFPTFTNVTPVCTRFGARVTGKAKFAHGTVTYTTQPAAFRDVGLGMNIAGTAGNEEPVVNLRYDFDGGDVLHQGACMALGGEAASGNTWRVSWTFAELPMTTGLDT